MSLKGLPRATAGSDFAAANGYAIRWCTAAYFASWLLGHAEKLRPPHRAPLISGIWLRSALETGTDLRVPIKLGSDPASDRVCRTPAPS